MECYKIEDLSFTYSATSKKTLDSIDFTVLKGEFVTICGKSGCGKTTLLRLLKSVLSPYGNLSGSISFFGKPLSRYSDGEQASKIGFVMQNPDSQIVTDKVWHELAFGLESLGYKSDEIRIRVSEMASFFGMESWFNKNVNQLSGGQKQLLNLASVMVMQPSVLILDEPTSQLDPICANDFLCTLERINRELGTTIILTEHRLEQVLPISDRVIVLDSGRIIANGNPTDVGEILKNTDHEMYRALPVPMRVYCAVDKEGTQCPLSVRDGRAWLEKIAESGAVNPEAVPKAANPELSQSPIIEFNDVYFRYDRAHNDVLKAMCLKIYHGEIFTLVGGNGSGKTTVLSLLSGINKPTGGKVTIKGREVAKIPDLHSGLLSALPQNPMSLFTQKTVYAELSEMLQYCNLTDEEKEKKILDVAVLCHIEDLLERHPYDLSGGEMQRSALAKVLLCDCEILLLDEPTKGMDADFKVEFAEILRELKKGGITVVMVSHDIEFCAEYSDRCAMLFDGGIVSEGTPREFFANKSFYTTSANRMARTVIKNAVLANDIIAACNGKTDDIKRQRRNIDLSKIKMPSNKSEHDKKRKISLLRIITASFFALMFVVFTVLQRTNISFSFLFGAFDSNTALQILSIFSAFAALFVILPPKKIGNDTSLAVSKSKGISKRTIAAALIILVSIPVTIFAGSYFLDDKRYYIISLLVIFETLIPFFAVFESRKPKAVELVVISVLCALVVTSRAAFFMVPQFKPVIALVIISGVCFGGETGFLVGAVSAFVSNFFFGQGPWTPWQMFALGIIGFIAGIIFKSGVIRKTKHTLCIFGFLTTIIVYGGIMNPAAVITAQSNPTVKMIATSYIAGLPFDLLHAFSTALFLWLISEPLLEKLERVKTKYGLIEA